MNKVFTKFGRHWLIPCAAGLIGGFIGSQFFLDDRIVVEDSVTGAPYTITSVDGRPVERVQHGILITRVPYALIDPGKHTLTLTLREDPEARPIDYEVEILKGLKYRLDQSDDGSPSIVARFD